MRWQTRRVDPQTFAALTAPAGQDLLARVSDAAPGESDLTVIMGLARFPGFSCVLVGQDRKAQREAYLGPGALRVAQRGFQLAEELGLPLLTVIDTPGADLSVEAEHGGMAGEIARKHGVSKAAVSIAWSPIRPTAPS